MARDEFGISVSRKLAERAGYLCGNPDCNSLTAGPAEKDPELSVRKGRASHICAAEVGGPRYDKNQTSAQRKSAENGIWLCASCGDLVDKNNGLDYTADQLRMWKTKHETMIRSLIKSNASPLALARKNTQEAQVAQQMADFIAGKGAFYVPADFEQHNYVVLSLTEVRKELNKHLKSIPVGEKLYEHIQIIREACQDYMNNTSTMNSPMEIDANLKIMRKKVGIVIRSLQEQYGVNVSGKLASITPALRANQ
jgi:uncharacterized protein YbdZ (MbtH family)